MQSEGTADDGVSVTTDGDNKDGRVPAGVFVTASGVALVGLAWWWSEDSLQEFLSVAMYSVGWALLTFVTLYLLTGSFDRMKWRRNDHDLVPGFEAGLADEGTQGSESQ